MKVKNVTNTKSANKYRCFISIALGLLLASANIAQAGNKHKINEGDILIAATYSDPTATALIKADPKTGQRILINDFSQTFSTGDNWLSGIAVGCHKQVFVTVNNYDWDLDAFAAKLFKIDPATGISTLVSNFSNSDGWINYGLAVDKKGDVIINFYTPTKRLVKVNPKTGQRATITDLSNVNQGVTEPDRFINDFVIEPSGKILIGTYGEFDTSNTIDSYSVIFRVDPKTGNRKVLSNFSNATQGNDVANLWFNTGLAIERSGTILVASGPINFGGRNLLFRINPVTGNRKVVSDFNNISQGELVNSTLRGVGLEKNGQIIVGGTQANSYSIFRVNPITGKRVVISDSINASQGPQFSSATYMTVVPNDILECSR